MAGKGSRWAEWEQSHSAKVGDQRRPPPPARHFVTSTKADGGKWKSRCKCGWTATTDSAGEAWAVGAAHVEADDPVWDQLTLFDRP